MPKKSSRRIGLFCCVALLGCALATADITGVITDAAGHPAPNARVFIEPGIEGAVIEGRVDLSGAFSLPGEFYGGVGVFAVAPGLGYGGVHLNIAAGEHPENLRIVLAPETAISGTIADTGGAAIGGARITSIAITHPTKVGIPFAKMAAFDVPVPVSDASGAFRVGHIPQGAAVALKFEHLLHAQEAVTDIRAGVSNLRVVMYRGVAVRGQVAIRGANAPVSGAMVAARNAQPPHDTAFAGSDGAGVFVLRLKPGVYLFQAHAAGRISPGLQRVEVSGELPEQNLRLALSETSRITGEIRDAKSGAPIPGVRVLLETQGQPAGAARSGPDGRFLLNAAAGDNLLYFDSMPGYLPPDTRALRVNAPGGDTLELSGFWLAPIPAFNLRVFEDDGETPVPGAFISLLRPRQFGWQKTDGDGRVVLQFTSLPDDNRIIGFAEHPDEDKGALFALDRSNAADASVALLPLAAVSGRVTNERGQAVAGAALGALFADDALPEALPLWRCLTDASGAFFWPAAPAGVPIRCVASHGQANAAAADMNPAPAERRDVGDIILAGAVSPEDHTPVQWCPLPHLCGPEAATDEATSLVVFYCRPDEAPVYIAAAASIREQLRVFGAETLVAVTGPYVCTDAPAPVYVGANAPSAACIYDSSGVLRLRALGLPPVAFIRALQRERQ